MDVDDVFFVPNQTTRTHYPTRIQRTKHSRSRMIGVMMETVRNLQIIENAISRWDRHQIDAVRKAYSRIVALGEEETGERIDPQGHVAWIEGIACGIGVRILKKNMLGDVLNEIETNASCDRLCDGCAHSASTFDPSTQFVVLSEPSVVSYVATPIVSPIEDFGENAMAVSPAFKCAVLWWNV